MTLCQYYNLYAKSLGYKCWNSYYALTNQNITNVKKRLKREYKLMYLQKLSSKEKENDQANTSD